MSTLRMSSMRRRESGDELGQPLPPRPRRRLLTRGTAAMTALLTCAIGFYAGVRVEKAQLPSSSATTGARALSGGRGALAALLAARAGGAGGAGGTGTGAAGTRATGAPPTGSGGAAGAGGLGRLLGGAGATFGTVSTVNGHTLYVTSASGNTVKVTLTSSTKVSKMRSAKRSAIRPGDTVAVQGITGSGGTVTAASVTDSGTRAGGSGAAPASGSGSSSSSSGSNSAIGSLFTPGG